jgi:CDP-diacylglycerol--glycerol-3-phosphate 3-phosphatidyltransferase
MPINLPNLVTLGRLVLAVVYLTLISRYSVDQAAQQRWLLDVCTVVFLLAALGDVLDGYLARSRNEVTSFGRILDPFVDKVLICGAYAFFAGPGFIEHGEDSWRPVTDVQMWMVVLIVGRELLVTGLRGFSESQGTPFAASFTGKTKMLLQSTTAVVILVTIARPGAVFGVAFNDVLRPVMVWLTVVVTVYSMLIYLWRARATLLEQSRA